jgi:hypothetical protein
MDAALIIARITVATATFVVLSALVGLIAALLIEHYQIGRDIDDDR